MVMNQVNIFEVKARLAEFLDRVARGERIVICRHNKPIAELRAVETRRTAPRPIGPLPGRPAFELASSFFEPLGDEALREWEGTDPVRVADVPLRRGGSSRVAESKVRYARGRKPRSGGRRSS
jgi:prevent-host-death family protein